MCKLFDIALIVVMIPITVTVVLTWIGMFEIPGHRGYQAVYLSGL